MLGRLLLMFGSIWLGQISIQNARRFIKSKTGRIEDKISALPDEISALPDDLLVRILLFLPTRDAVSTAILSNDGGQFGRWPPIDVGVDIKKWITDAVDRKVRKLEFKLSWLSKPIRLPDSLYICNTLVFLTISDKILVDVPSLVCFPSLETLFLFSVVYKDEDALVRLLSGCPILKHLGVVRHGSDNLKNISLKVPCLKTLYYCHEEVAIDNDGLGGSVVIDSPTLRKIFLRDISTNSYSIENNPRLDKALIQVFSHLDEKFTRSLSSVMYLDLILNFKTVGCCCNIKFSQLIECKIIPFGKNWLKPFMLFLQNSPKLKVLVIEQTTAKNDEDFIQPSSVPECLSNSLEIFEWKNYKGRKGEKELVRFILANSKCLKRVGISIKQIRSGKVKKELKSMTRVSTSSQLLFSTQLKFDYSIQGETQCPFKVFIQPYEDISDY